MSGSANVEIRISDLPEFRAMFAAARTLLVEVESAEPLPDAVVDAAHHFRAIIEEWER